MLAASRWLLAVGHPPHPSPFTDHLSREFMRTPSSLTDLRILIRGAGEMASGIAHRLFSSHLRVALTEAPHPGAVRRKVSFCEAVWDGTCEVESVRARRVDGAERFDRTLEGGELPVLVDPELSCVESWRPHAVLDAAHDLLAEVVDGQHRAVR